MSHLDPKRPATSKELRQFGLLVGGAFLAIGVITLLRHRPVMVSGAFGGLGAVLVLVGLAMPKALARVYAGWMGFAVLLSKVTTPIFMGVIYFVVLTPVGLVMRVIGKHPLGAPRGDSEWVTRPSDMRRSALQRQF